MKPGAIEEKLDQIILSVAELKIQVTALNGWKNRVIGASMALSVLVPAAVAYLVKFL